MSTTLHTTDLKREVTIGGVDFIPFSDWILVEMIANNQTAGGIALPDGSDNGAPRGRVIKAGPGRANEMTGEVMPMPVKVGDVLYVLNLTNAPGMGDIPISGRKFFILRARDQVGRIQNPVENYSENYRPVTAANPQHN